MVSDAGVFIRGWWLCRVVRSPHTAWPLADLGSCRAFLELSFPLDKKRAVPGRDL